MQLILAILNECKDINDITEMKLHKLIYFCETNYFKQFWERITNFKYLKNYHWPTFCEIPSIFSSLMKYADIYKKGQYTYFKLKDNVNIKELITDIDLKYIKKVLIPLKHETASSLRKLSHKDIPYLAAELKWQIDIEDVLYDEWEIWKTELNQDEKEKALFAKMFNKNDEDCMVKNIDRALSVW